MTKIEEAALMLYTDCTLLELKAFKKTSGLMERFEDHVLNAAIEMHRLYRSMKLDQSNPLRSGKDLKTDGI